VPQHLTACSITDFAHPLNSKYNATGGISGASHGMPVEMCECKTAYFLFDKTRPVRYFLPLYRKGGKSYQEDQLGFKKISS